MPEVKQSLDLHEVPLPARIGGDSIDHERVIGPPSRLYPVLRDLVNSPAVVTIEVDTKSDRVVGVIDGIVPAVTPHDPKRPERLIVMSTPLAQRLARVKHTVSFPDIIAFRVLKVEAVLGEKGLVL